MAVDHLDAAQVQPPFAGHTFQHTLPNEADVRTTRQDGFHGIVVGDPGDDQCRVPGQANPDLAELECLHLVAAQGLGAGERDAPPFEIPELPDQGLSRAAEDGPSEGAGRTATLFDHQGGEGCRQPLALLEQHKMGRVGQDNIQAARRHSLRELGVGERLDHKVTLG